MALERIFIDTDIILDVVLDRKDFYKYSSVILDNIQNKKFMGFVAWHSISNLYYLLRPKVGKISTMNFIDDLTNILQIAPTSNDQIKLALKLNSPDFEDSMQISCAIASRAKYIITRNISHYKKSPIEALSPRDFIKLSPHL